MLTAVAILAPVLLAAVAVSFAARRLGRPAPVSIVTVGVRRSLVCADCSGSIGSHADWCGRGERPAWDEDRREVKGRQPGARVRIRETATAATRAAGVGLDGV